jgi:hypothetical protein
MEDAAGLEGVDDFFLASKTGFANTAFIKRRHIIRSSCMMRRYGNFQLKSRDK